METRKLIGAISADAARSRLSMRKTWLFAGVLSVAMAALAFFTMLGVRPDFAEAVVRLRFLLKFVMTIALALAASAILVRLTRPADKPFTAWLYLAPALLFCDVAVEMASVPSVRWSARLVGTNSVKCLTFIPLIGIGPLVVLLAAVRHGASTRPTYSGAIAGILAGGLAASLYAAHCPDDSSLFVATWYTIAIVCLGFVGALAGARVTLW